MEINLRNDERNLEYRTDQFRHRFEVEENEYSKDSGWNCRNVEREALTQMEAKMSLTQRSSLLDDLGNEWYVAYVDHIDDIDPDVLSQRPKAHPYSLDTPGNDKNVLPEIEQRLREAFPDHNVELKLGIHSAIKSSVKVGTGRHETRDHYDLRDVFRPVIGEFVDYLVQEGIGKIS